MDRMLSLAALAHRADGVVAVVVDPGGVHVADVVLDDPSAPAGPGDLVLAVSARDLHGVRAAVSRAAASGAAAVAARRAGEWDEGTAHLARKHGIALVGLAPGSSWTHVWRVLRDAVASGGPAGTADRSSAASDLFALADQAALVLDAPVTVEDTASRVLAYSFHQDLTDSARIATIVGRQVPDAIVAHFRSRGVFRRLTVSDAPVFVPAGPGGILPRTVVPIRAGGLWIGALWAVTESAVPEPRLAQLHEVVAQISLHLVRLRAQADLARRDLAASLRSALRGEPGGAGPVAPSDGPWRVVSLLGLDDTMDPVARSDLWDALLRRAGWARPLVTDVDAAVVAVVDERRLTVRRAAEGALPLEATFAALRAEDPSVQGLAGGTVARWADLPRSLAQSAELAALARVGRLTAPMHRWEDSWGEVVVGRAVASTPGLDEIGGPFAVLLEHDARHGTAYVETLATWFELGQSPEETGRALHVHTNTVRYRLRKAAELTGVDLDDSTTRLALSLQAFALPRGRARTRRPGTL